MSYFYLILQALIFSFGGLLIKESTAMVSPMMLSFLRFFIGLFLLLIILKGKDGKVKLTFGGLYIILGGILKAVHYLGENYGVMKGVSYGGIIVWPVQTLVVLLISLTSFHEKISLNTLLGTLLCVLGIGLVTWNGIPLETFLGSEAKILLAFVLAGIGAAGFSFAQKRLVKTMDPAEMNASMFFYGMLTTVLVLLLTGKPTTGPATLSGTVSICILGIITCVGFLLQAYAIRTVPLLIATIIQSSTVILTIVWGVLFRGDALTSYVIAGTALFLAGILLINLRGGKEK